MKKIFLLCLTACFFLLISSPVWSATYYIATTGSDSNLGTQSQPWATFAYAFSKMSGGDTLYVMDGTYNQTIANIPAGSPGNYTKIYALNNHKVDIDGKGTISSTLLNVNSTSHVEVKGIKVHHGGSNVCQIANSNNIIFRIVGCWHAGPTKYDKIFRITNSYDILIEDSWAFGRGRYTTSISDEGRNVTYRRVVTRWDDGKYDGEPIAGMVAYRGYNNIIENFITFDHKNAGGHSAGKHGFYVESWNPSFSASDSNYFYGSIALNNTDATGWTIGGTDPVAPDNTRIYNSVAIGNNRGFYVISDPTNTLITNVSAIGNIGVHGIYNGSTPAGTVTKNSLSINNADKGVKHMENMALSYVGAYNNAGGNFEGSCITGCRSDNPQLLYPLRVENSSPYKGTGEGGADIGANIVNRYVDGVLTTEPLWPWPYENWIKEDMCNPTFLAEVGRTGADTPKWCTTSKTLTQYIWEHLGNSCPTDICDYKKPSPPMNLKVE